MNRIKYYTILLAVLMSMTGAKVFANDIEAKNANGVTIYYEWINNNTELAVSFRGYSYSIDHDEYSGYVVIPESVEYGGSTYKVTSIGSNAFRECTSLTSVIIPNSVTTIENFAFYGCNGLTSVTIPQELTTIGNFAFRFCKSLKTINIPKSVTSIGEHAFIDCSGLTSMNIHSNAISIGFNAFANCSNLVVNYYVTDIIDLCNNTVLCSIGCPVTLIDNKGNEIKELIIPKEITTIREYAFYYCCGLTSVTIPNNVTSIGEAAFRDCESLYSVTIPNSVTSIGRNAFYGCSSLTTLVIGSGVTNIGEGALNFVNLKKAIWLTNTPPTGYYNASGEINYVSNDQFSFYNQVKYQFLSSYFDVDGIKYVPVSPSERTCDAIDCVYDESATNTRIASTVVYKGVTMTVKNIKPFFAYNNNYIKTLSVENDGELAYNSFANCNNLKSVTLGKKVSAIGNGAFSGCSSLDMIDIPDMVTELRERTFSGCTSLKEIKIGSNVKTIYDYALSECSALPSITIPSAVTTIKDAVFYNCTSLKNVFFTECEAELNLGSNANQLNDVNWDYSNPLFSSCPLDSVFIGRNINYSTSQYSGYSPFYRNISLRAVKLSDKETDISDNEFYGCTNLQRVTIGDGVTTIGKRAFSGCSSLKLFAFGSQVAEIGEEAFSDCAALVQIISKAQAAPTCGPQALDDINKWECKLYVPDGCMASYEAANQWKDFFFMEEGEGMPPHEPVIGDVNCDGKVNNDDLNDLVSYIMGNNPNGVTQETANLNGDNKVDIADVVALVSLLK